MHVHPTEPRFTIQDTFNGIEATIPAARNGFVLLFMSAWIVGWGVGELSAIHQLLSHGNGPPELFMLAWLAGWTMGGAWAAGTIAWQLGGREVVVVGPSTLQHRIEAFGIGRTRTYQLADVKDFRTVELVRSPFANQSAWLPSFTGSVGAVAFDYGARTYRFAPSLDEAEAKLLVSKLGARLSGRSA